MRQALAGLGLLLATTSMAHATNASACKDLLFQQLDDARIISAEMLTEPFDARDPVFPAARVTTRMCRVIAVATPVPESEIRFEVWLPRAEDWTGRFEGVGSGGSRGGLNYPALASSVARGSAGMANDNGHISTSGYDGAWALGHPERIADFGWRAQHVTTVLGKDISRAFYARTPRHSYFLGCSQGGHHALMEAERFPDDYDGILAGAPANQWTGLMVAQAWAGLAATRAPEAMIPEAKLPALHAAAIKACAAPSGLIENPAACSFNPVVTQCRGGDAADCLTAPQVETARRIYAGPSTSAGRPLYSGYPVGSELSWGGLWAATATPGGSWADFFRYALYGDAKFDLAKLDFDTAPDLAREKLGGDLDAVSTDLSAFRDGGGKLLMYHGLADPLISPYGTRDWVRNVTTSTAQSSDFLRLFLAPGMAHCGGGPGLNSFGAPGQPAPIQSEPQRDIVAALQFWVETGRAPDTLIASHRGTSDSRTGLLCAWPKVAIYRRGPRNSAASYVCGDP
jgi:feruloyl esterase